MLHTKPSNKLFIIQLLFFFAVFLLISRKAGKAKWIEKRTARSRLVKQIFLQYNITVKITVQYRRILVIYSRFFVHYFVQLDNNN